MTTKTIDWHGVRITAVYTDDAVSVAYDKLTLENPEDLLVLLDRMVVVVPCEEHLMHVLPALSELAAVLEPPPPSAPGGTLLN